MLEVLSPGFAEYRNIVDVRSRKVEQVVEDQVHQSLKCRRRISEAKRHKQIFILAPRRAKSRLFDVIGFHGYLVESFVEVQYIASPKQSMISSTASDMDLAQSPC